VDLGFIANKLPQSVREDISFSQHARTISTLRIFDVPGCDEPFLRCITRLLKVDVFLDNDLIFRENELSDKCYFIDKGYVQIGNYDFSTVYTVLPGGTYMGEFALLGGRRRKASALALTDVITHSLGSTDFQNVVQSFKMELDPFLQVSRVLQEEYRKEAEDAEARQHADGAPSAGAKEKSWASDALECVASITPKALRGGKSSGKSGYPVDLDRRRSMSSSEWQTHVPHCGFDVSTLDGECPMCPDGSSSNAHGVSGHLAT